MAVLDSNKTRQSLVKKGFSQAEGHHHFYLFKHQGKVVSKTKMSHDGQDINDYLISKMSKQCRISKKDFLDLINCPLEKEGYINKLKESGDIIE